MGWRAAQVATGMEPMARTVVARRAAQVATGMEPMGGLGW
jgi:hypothetical protein